MEHTQLVVSHKRTSSTAENLNSEQPPQKQSRQEGQDGLDMPSSPSDTASSSSSDDEPLLHGVYIVQYSISQSDSDANDSRIVGVYVSEEDADNEVIKQKLELVDAGAKPGHITDLDHQSGWEWKDEPKIHICSYQFHPLIWPKRARLEFVSEESSLGGVELDDFPGSESEAQGYAA
ncbi:hypothetical protein GQ53DRAFT_749560 [Thozetella sp. PMI_491]|nr:hypothetical protein GQ53DRAFT_749560 [Thozetella sp. PMI_491]